MTSPPLVSSVTHTYPRIGSLTSWPMVSDPVSRLTVEVIACVVGSIVAITSPGKFRPLSTARTSLLSGDMPMD